MADLARRDNVFDELFDFRHTFDNMFNRLLRDSRSGKASDMEIVSVPPAEAWVDSKNKKFHVRFALPGVDANEVQLEVEGNMLTVSGEHETDEEKTEADYVLREFSYERFRRSVPLPEGVDTEKISAEYNNGMLEVTVPLSESALPKQVPIKSLPKAKGTSA
jgi:HSP20 family protein